MMLWVMYDISVDKVRRKVERICKDLGLRRMQYSAFFGSADKAIVKKASKRIAILIDSETDSVIMFPVSKIEYESALVIGRLVEVDNTIKEKCVVL